MEDNQKFQCSGDCLNCRALPDRKVQWQYCAAQHAYNTMRMIEALQQSVTNMQGTIIELTAKVETIQSSEAVAVVPSIAPVASEYPLFNGIAQSGDGAAQ